MRRVTAVDSDGKVLQIEGERKGHNELVYELFEEFLEPLQDEELKGDAYIKIWPNAGFVTKYLDMMLYLEVDNDEASIDSVVCTIPENLSDTQLNYYEENYLDKDAPFLGLHYHDDIFSSVSEDREEELSSEELYNYLKDMVKSKSK